MKAEELITKWEDEMGPLKNLRADLYGPGGRMEGIRKIAWKNGEIQDDVRPSLMHMCCISNNLTGGEVSVVR